jgi:hypothetical protein
MRPHNSGKLTTREGTRSHAGVLPTGSAEPVRGLATYRSQAEEFPIAVADGKVFYRSAGTANTTVLMKANKTSAFSVGPAFHADTVNVSTVKRTGGAVTGNDVWGNRARITSATYNAALSQATYTILIEGYTFVAGATVIGDVIKTTGGTKADWVTISQMSYSEYDGTFEVVSVSQSISGPDLTVTIVASNANGDSTTPADSASGGFCEILTNVISVATNSGLAAGDVITGVYNNTNTTLYAPNSEVSLKGLSGTTFVIQFTEDEYIAGTNLDLRGQRTTSVVPVVATTGMAVDNVMQIGSYNRHFQITAINSLNVTVNDTITLSHGDAVTEPYTWSQADVPGGSGDLVPASPTRIFAADPDARVRTASIQDSVYMTNGVDPVVKFDGVDIYQAGLPNWDPCVSIHVDTDHAGIALESAVATSIVGTDPDTGVSTERSATFASPVNVSTGGIMADGRTGRVYPVLGYDPITYKVSFGDVSQELLPASITFTSSDVDTTNNIINKILPATADVLVNVSNTGGSLPTGLSAGVDYRIRTVNSGFQFMGISELGDSDKYSQSVDLSAAGSGTNTVTVLNNVFYIPKRYSYYLKLEMIDANNNLVASAVRGYGSANIYVTRPGAVVLSALMPVPNGQVPYDRVELSVYRTFDLIADPTALTHYRLRNIAVSYDAVDHRVNIVDMSPDESLTEIDSVSTAIKGADIPVVTERPAISKYIGAASNRLLQANIKGPETLDFTVTRTTSEPQDTVSCLDGSSISITDSSSTFTAKFLNVRDSMASVHGSAYFTNSGPDLVVGANASYQGVYWTDELTVGASIQFYVTGGTLAPGITAGTTYWVVAASGTGSGRIFKLSANKGGTVITYAGSGSGTFYAAASNSEYLHNVAPSSCRAGHITAHSVYDWSLSNSGGDLVVTMNNDLDVLPIKLNDRVRFHRFGSASATPDYTMKAGLTPETIYYAQPTSGSVYNSFKLSTTPGGAAVPYVSNTGNAIIEFMDAFFIRPFSNTRLFRTDLIPGGGTATPTATAWWVNLESYSFEPDFFNYASDTSLGRYLRNGEDTQTQAHHMVRFMGWWKTSYVWQKTSSTPVRAAIRVEYKHDLNLNPRINNSNIGFISGGSGSFINDTLVKGSIAVDELYAGFTTGSSPAVVTHPLAEDFQVIFTIAKDAPTTTIPILANTSDLIFSRKYRDNFTQDGDVAGSMRDLATAFNTYQRSLSSPWARAEWKGRTVSFIALDPAAEISGTFTAGTAGLVDTYFNGVFGTSGSGAKRVFPSRMLRSYENFPEIMDNPYSSSASDSDSIIDIKTAEGQEITGIGTFFADSFSPGSGGSAKEDVIVAAKTASVYAVNIKSREYQKLESHGKGCTAPDSMAATPTGIMFANNYGVYRVRPDLAVDYPGEAIEELWKTVNKDYLHLATATVDPHDRLYKIAVPTGTSTVNNEIFCYDYSREGQDQPYGAWFRTTLEGATCWATTVNDTLMGTEDGDIVQIRRDADDDGGDYQEADGSAIEAEIVLATEDFGDAGLKKRVRRFQVDVDLDESDVTGISVQQAVNTEDQWRDCGDADLTRSNTSSMAHQQEPTISWTPPVRACYRTQFKITHGVAKEKLTISGIGYKVDGISDRGARENVDPNAGSN